MSMKTILVPMHHETMRPSLETALLLGRQCDSYIEGFALRSGINVVVGGAMMGGFSLERYTEDIEEEAKEARQIFESFMQRHNVPRSIKTIGTLSFGWLDNAPEGPGFVGSYGRVFDVIVMSRPDANTSGLYNEAIECGLFESGRPILLSPPSLPSQIATNVLIAWNRSTEQARAIALAMPLLHRAENITILTVSGGTEVPGPSAEQLVRYLRCNGIIAEPMTVGLDGRNTGEAILATAQSLSCDLLIKGAYTQSRLRQMIFGGATQHVLANATMPILLAN